MQGSAYIRLSELAAIVGQVIGNYFSKSTYWVLAEVSGHQYKQQKNYHSFDLVEKSPNADGLIARFSAKAWGSGSAAIQAFEQKTGQRFSSNIEVLAKVKVVFHGQYGLALDLQELDAAYTVGKLYEARQLTLQRLLLENDFIEKTAAGYMTRNKVAQLPRVIQKIAIISSLTSAGMEDFIHTLENNPEGYRFEMDKYLTVVQGVNNADQLVDQLVAIFTSGKQYDAVLLLRGGGAGTDFILFDNYHIARAIAKFPIPIITGIGHQKNETLADLMAHTATKTPTQAAEFILHHNNAFEKSILDLRQQILLHAKTILLDSDRLLTRLNNRVLNRTTNLMQVEQRSLNRTQNRLAAAARQLLFVGHQALSNNRHQVVRAADRSLQWANNQIKEQKGKIGIWSTFKIKSSSKELSNLQVRIRLMSPERILQKGFALLKVNGKYTSTTQMLQPGQQIEIITAKAKLDATIQNIKQEEHGNEFNL